MVRILFAILFFMISAGIIAECSSLGYNVDIAKLSLDDEKAKSDKEKHEQNKQDNTDKYHAHHLAQGLFVRQSGIILSFEISEKPVNGFAGKPFTPPNLF